VHCYGLLLQPSRSMVALLQSTAPLFYEHIVTPCRCYFGPQVREHTQQQLVGCSVRVDHHQGCVRVRSCTLLVNLACRVVTDIPTEHLMWWLKFSRRVGVVLPNAATKCIC
jgi:hypothetical protein